MSSVDMIVSNVHPDHYFSLVFKKFCDWLHFYDYAKNASN